MRRRIEYNLKRVYDLEFREKVSGGDTNEVDHRVDEFLRESWQARDCVCVYWEGVLKWKVLDASMTIP